jgi:hypothetical protein
MAMLGRVRYQQARDAVPSIPPLRTASIFSSTLSLINGGRVTAGWRLRCEFDVDGVLVDPADELAWRNRRALVPRLGSSSNVPLTDARFREIVKELHARHGIRDQRDVVVEAVDVVEPIREQ